MINIVERQFDKLSKKIKDNSSKLFKRLCAYFKRQTILEDGVYKMLKSKIKEVENPGWDWFMSDKLFT